MQAPTRLTWTVALALAAALGSVGWLLYRSPIYLFFAVGTTTMVLGALFLLSYLPAKPKVT